MRDSRLRVQGRTVEDLAKGRVGRIVDNIVACIIVELELYRTRYITQSPSLEQRNMYST